MSRSFSRRPLLQGLAAATVVIGFDLRRRSWITEAAADPGAIAGLPPLDGTLFTDPAHIEAAADDFGHIVSRTPVAVLLPGSIRDIQAIICFARRYGIKVAMRGQGHAQFGSAQVQGGIVIDSSSLATIHSIGPDRADVDAGVIWRDLLHAAGAQGLTPAVLTDYLGLSVGGTLSVGGLGGTTQHFGIQADNVFELQVVTGIGELVTCSPAVRPDLFYAVLAGLGQFAIIVRATVRLVPAETNALVFHLFYDDISRYVQDQTRLVEEERFSYLEGQIVPRADGNGWRFMIEAVEYFTPPSSPDQTALLEGLGDDRPTAEIFVQTYEDFALRVDPLVELLQSLGVWGFPHPWLSLFVPASVAVDYVGRFVSTLTLADTGQGPILFYPIKTGRVTLPLYRLPDEPIAFAFNVLRTAAPPTPDVVSAMLASNRTLYDELFALGGTRYAIGAIPFSPHDWQRHFGPKFGFLVDSKAHFDPDLVLTPGAGIFG